MQKLARYWATDYDWRKCEARLNALPQFITEIDGLDIHFIHVRSKQTNALPLIVTHGWPGSIIEQLKIIEPLTNPTAHGGTRGGRVRRRDSVAARLRVFRQADRDRLGSRPHRARVGRADEAPRIHAIRGAGRRLGRGHASRWRCRRPPGLIGIHTNMPATVPADIDKALAAGGPAAGRPLGRREARVRPARLLLQARPRLRAARWRTARRRCTASRIRRSAWPRGFDARPRRAQLRAHRARLRRSARGPDARRHPRQHHALLADEHGGLVGPALLGKQAGAFFAPKGVTIPVAVSVFPGRDLSGAAELGREGVSQAHPLQQARQGRPLRGLGAAASLCRQSCARRSSQYANRH